MTVTAAPPSLTVSPAQRLFPLFRGRLQPNVVSLTGNASYSGAVNAERERFAQRRHSFVVQQSGHIDRRERLFNVDAHGLIHCVGDFSNRNHHCQRRRDHREQTNHCSGGIAATGAHSLGCLVGRFSCAREDSNRRGFVGRQFVLQGAVTLSVSGLPSGVTASWSSNPVTLASENGSSTLTLTGSSAASLVSATVTITASGDAISATKQITVQVLPAPSLTIAAASTSLSVVPGQMITDVITLTGDATYSGAATLERHWAANRRLGVMEQQSSNIQR